MASSHSYQINEIVETIKVTRPKRILDIGIGFGKYGFLSREYLELWDVDAVYGKWDRQIDGVEAFAEYVNDAHRYIYDNIFIGEAQNILPQLKEKYDLIIMVDVLEHFEYPVGQQILKLCEQKARNVLIATPKDSGDKGI